MYAVFLLSCPVQENNDFVMSRLCRDFRYSVKYFSASILFSLLFKWYLPLVNPQAPMRQKI